MIDTKDLVHGAYYWLRLANNEDDGRDVVVDTRLSVYCMSYGLYIAQYNRSTGKFDFCGDDLGHYPENFDVLEMVEYKGDK